MNQFERIHNTPDVSVTVAASVGRLLEPGEVARWLGVSAGWVRDHATRKQPRLKAIKVGKLLRFRPQDVEEFITTWCQ